MPAFRDTERNFRRYEPYIRLMVTHPNVQTIDPAPMNASTFVGRMRDAIKAYLQEDCPWVSDVNRAALRQRWRECTITTLPGTVACPDYVRIGSRLAPVDRKVGTILDSPNEDPTKGLDVVAIVTEAELDVVQALVLLLSKSVLHGRVVLNAPLQETVDWLYSIVRDADDPLNPSPYNVSIEGQPDHNRIIII